MHRKARLRHHYSTKNTSSPRKQHYNSHLTTWRDTSSIATTGTSITLLQRMNTPTLPTTTNAQQYRIWNQTPANWKQSTITMQRAHLRSKLPQRTSQKSNPDLSNYYSDTRQRIQRTQPFETARCRYYRHGKTSTKHLDTKNHLPPFQHDHGKTYRCYRRS